ncbi:MAG: Ni/Fe-hydrogenase cytochrome b subunit [Deltaproteobacteria bacterium]|nr:Ni/Fe-hydrogenase cytochrome b subunit [Deltaproteobacteria bacterium]
MSAEIAPRPVRTVPCFTSGVFALLAVVAVGGIFAAWRLISGLSAVTNLSDQYPWGLWIAVDVATGVALAAGGFTTGALAYVFGGERYRAVVRSALLTAMLGYTFVAVGLLVDLGRPYAIWHPMIYWQGNSVLFEVGICVMSYLAVLYLEFLPIVVERYKDGVALPRPFTALGRPIHSALTLTGRVMDRALPFLILAGVVLSCLHQSSLGTLMLIAPTKMHALWFTPISPLLFLMSAIAVGYPMVIVESMIASRSLKLEPEMDVLGPLARFIPVFLGLYLAMKVGDMSIRGTWRHLVGGSPVAPWFAAEMIGGVATPLFMLLFRRVRRSPPLLFAAALMVVLGVALNRLNVFLVAYSPPFAAKAYFPSPGEIAVTAALISTLVLAYRFTVMNFPVIAGRSRAS